MPRLARSLTSNELSSPLLSLPAELRIAIIQFACTPIAVPEITQHCLLCPPSAKSKECFTTLHRLARTCTNLYHTITCQENDDAIWKHIAMCDVGIDSRLKLEDLIYPGFDRFGDKLEGKERSWRKFVLYSRRLERGFIGCGDIEKDRWKVKKALPQLPGTLLLNGQSRGFQVRMSVAGLGNQHENIYYVKDYRGGAKERGKITFQLRKHEGRGFIGIGQNRATVITAVADLCKEEVKIVHEGRSEMREWRLTNYPEFGGYVAFQEAGTKEWTIKKVDVEKGGWMKNEKSGLDVVFRLGNRKPERWAGDEEGKVLVVVVYDDPEKPRSGIASKNMPSSLVCFERVDRGSRIRWEYDVTREWAEEDRYTCFPHLKNFHLTKNYLIALVTRHPSSQFLKLTGQYFLVVCLETGKLIFMNNLCRPSPKPSRPGFRTQVANLPPPFTTAFSHDFLVTDNLIISGGLGGGIQIMKYLKQDPECKIPKQRTYLGSPIYDTDNSIPAQTNKLKIDARISPIYHIPDPWLQSSPYYKFNNTPRPQEPLDTRPTGAGGLGNYRVGRHFTNITLSDNGRYLGAVTSDQLWVWDLFTKKLAGIWSNGRKIDVDRDWYAKNPVDGFEGGIWVLLEKPGEEEGELLVAYLARLGKEEREERNENPSWIKYGWYSVWIVGLILGVISSLYFFS